MENITNNNTVPADEKEFGKKLTALACGNTGLVNDTGLVNNTGSVNTGLVNFISVGLMIFCTLSF